MNSESTLQLLGNINTPYQEKWNFSLLPSVVSVSESAKHYLLNHEDLVATLTSLISGGGLNSDGERTERLYFTGADYTINLIPIALVTAAVLGCNLKLKLFQYYK